MKGSRPISCVAVVAVSMLGCTVHHHYNGPVVVSGRGGPSPAPASPCPVCPPVRTCEGSSSPSVTSPVPLVPRTRGPRTYPVHVAIDPEHEAVVMSPVDGRVASLRATMSQIVRRNDVVATIEPSRGGRPVELRAPIDGEVVDRPAALGQEVAHQQSTPLVYVADLSEVWVVAAVPQAELPTVHPGAPVEIRFSMFPDRVFLANVTRIVPTIDPQTGTGHVVMTVPNNDRSLRPGAAGTLALVEPAPASSSAAP